MTLDYTTRGEVKIDMQKYVKDMIDEFLMKIYFFPMSSNSGNQKYFKGGHK